MVCSLFFGFFSFDVYLSLLLAHEFSRPKIFPKICPTHVPYIVVEGMSSSGAWRWGWLPGRHSLDMANLVSLSALPRQSADGYSVVICQESEQTHWLGCLDMAVLWLLLHFQSLILTWAPVPKASIA